MTRHWILAAALVLLACPASAQIKPTGQFVPGHTIRCMNSSCTVAGDAGGANGSSIAGAGYLTELGITNKGVPFSISSDLVSSPNGYRQLSLGFDANGNGLIAFNAFGGATATGLKCMINGQTYDCINNGSGNVMGPGSTNTQAVAVFNNNTGTLLADASQAGAIAKVAHLVGELLSTGAAFTPTDNYSGTTANTQILSNLGTLGTPDTTQDAVAIFGKVAGTATTTGKDQALYSYIIKTQSGSNTHSTAAFFEAQDNAGWSGVGMNSFIEGVRAHAVLHTGTLLGFANAGAFSAGEEATATHSSIIGVESEVTNVSADAGIVLDPLHVVASFVATSSGTKKVDAAFLVNQFLGGTNTNAAAYRNALYVPAGAGAVTTPVTDSVVRSDVATVYGINFTNAPTNTMYAVIGSPANTTIIRAEKHDFSTQLNMLATDNSDNLFVGIDATEIQIGQLGHPTLIPGHLILTTVPTSCASQPTGTVSSNAGVLTLCP